MSHFITCTLCSFLIITGIIYSEKICDGKDGVICCFGYTWNEEIKECIKCGPGYFGQNCSKVCPYPSYGDKCGNKCDCPKQFCQPENGCSSTTEITDHLTSPGRSNIIGTIYTLVHSKPKSSTSTTKLNEAKKTMLTSEDTPSLITKRNVLNDPMSAADRVLQYASQTGVLAIILFLFIAIIIYLVQRGKFYTKKINNKESQILSTDSGHYHSLENIDQSFHFASIDGLVFESRAGVELKYDSKLKQYLLGFKTPNESQGTSCSAMREHNYHDDQFNEAKGSTSTQKFPNPLEHHAYVDMKASQEKTEPKDPYLMVVHNDYSNDCSSLIKKAPPQKN